MLRASCSSWLAPALQQLQAASLLCPVCCPALLCSAYSHAGSLSHPRQKSGGDGLSQRTARIFLKRQEPPHHQTRQSTLPLTSRLQNSDCSDFRGLLGWSAEDLQVSNSVCHENIGLAKEVILLSRRRSRALPVGGPTSFCKPEVSTSCQLYPICLVCFLFSRDFPASCPLAITEGFPSHVLFLSLAAQCSSQVPAPGQPWEDPAQPFLLHQESHGPQHAHNTGKKTPCSVLVDEIGASD